EKTSLSAEAWRNLQAYLTAQTDYFVSKGVSISPAWAASEKLTLSFEVLWDNQRYVGTPDPALGQNSLAGRRDTVTAAKGSLLYKPIRWLTVDVSYAQEHRNSNQSIYDYR